MAMTTENIGLMKVCSHFAADRELAYVTGYVSGLLGFRELTALEAQYFDLVKTKAAMLR